MPRKVATLIDGDMSPPGETPRDPEKAADALGGIEFLDGEGNPTDKPQPPTPATGTAPTPRAPAKRTKAELQAEVDRLASEVERHQKQAAANAPDIVEAIKTPLRVTFEAAFEAASAFRGEHWKLKEGQAEALAAVWAPVVGPLVASHPELVVWSGAIAVTYGVVVPRVKRDRELVELKKAEAHTGPVAEVK
jgi:hypothetical protein